MISWENKSPGQEMKAGTTLCPRELGGHLSWRPAAQVLVMPPRQRWTRFPLQDPVGSVAAVSAEHGGRDTGQALLGPDSPSLWAGPSACEKSDSRDRHAGGEPERQKGPVRRSEAESEGISS